MEKDTHTNIVHTCITETMSKHSTDSRGHIMILEMNWSASDLATAVIKVY